MAKLVGIAHIDLHDVVQMLEARAAKVIRAACVIILHVLLLRRGMAVSACIDDAKVSPATL